MTPTVYMTIMATQKSNILDKELEIVVDLS